MLRKASLRPVLPLYSLEVIFELPVLGPARPPENVSSALSGIAWGTFDARLAF